MRPLICTLLLMAPAWAGHTRQTVDTSRSAQPARRTVRPAVSRTRAAASLGKKAATPVQAPGVIQTNLMDASNVVWFVTAEALPRGTEIYPFVVFPDGTEMPLEGITLTEDLAAGESFDMPNVRKFGPFWPSGLMTYGVVVVVDGSDTQTAADFPVAAARNYDDVTRMVPRIASTFEGVSDGNMVLSIRGTFTSERPYVLLEDMVVPRAAVQLSDSEIRVNLSAVPGLDLSVMQELLLTVGQSNWCDTAVFRHLPAAPGTYNAAP